MKKFLLLFQFLTVNSLFHLKKNQTITNTDYHTPTNVKIYSNLAEIIQPLGKFPLEFSADDWSNIRTDSITLIGSNVTIIEQTITEMKQSFNNLQIYVRSPSSSHTEKRYVKATMIDENQRLVKLIDTYISVEPIFLTVQTDDIIYVNEPSQSKYYVNFTYDTTNDVYVSYLRSNLNWKTRYQLNLFEESKIPVLIAMADIRNNGKTKLNIEHAELLGGDINLRMFEHHRSERYEIQQDTVMYAPANAHFSSGSSSPSISRAEELSGLYVFSINQPFSIEGKTNYLLSMFRPKITVERYSLIQKTFFNGVGSSNDKAQRSYRLSSDRFLSRGNCIIREYDRLVGETLLPNLAANDKYEFSIGQDTDIIYKENITLVSSRTYNETIRSANNEYETRTQSVYMINLLIKNFKQNRSVKIEYRQEIYGRSMKLITNNTEFIQDGSTIKSTMTLPASDEKFLSYKIEIIN